MYHMSYEAYMRNGYKSFMSSFCRFKWDLLKNLRLWYYTINPWKIECSISRTLSLRDLSFARARVSHYKGSSSLSFPCVSFHQLSVSFKALRTLPLCWGPQLASWGGGPSSRGWGPGSSAESRIWPERACHLSWRYPLRSRYRILEGSPPVSATPHRVQRLISRPLPRLRSTKRHRATANLFMKNCRECRRRKIREFSFNLGGIRFLQDSIISFFKA